MACAHPDAAHAGPAAPFWRSAKQLTKLAYVQPPSSYLSRRARANGRSRDARPAAPVARLRLHLSLLPGCPAQTSACLVRPQPQPQPQPSPSADQPAETRLFSPFILQQMAASIPSRFAMSDWRLLYSTLVHGTLEYPR